MIYLGIMLFVILALLLAENVQWNISIPAITLFSLFFCFVIFRSLKTGIYIDGKDIYVQGDFRKKKVNTSEIKAIKITRYAMWGRMQTTYPQKDKHGNQLYSAVFLREIIPDIKDHYNDLDIIKYYRKKVMFKIIYDKEAVDYILTLNPSIKLLIADSVVLN